MLGYHYLRTISTGCLKVASLASHARRTLEIFDWEQSQTPPSAHFWGDLMSVFDQNKILFREKIKTFSLANRHEVCLNNYYTLPTSIHGSMENACFEVSLAFGTYWNVKINYSQLFLGYHNLRTIYSESFLTWSLKLRTNSVLRFCRFLEYALKMSW